MFERNYFGRNKCFAGSGGCPSSGDAPYTLSEIAADAFVDTGRFAGKRLYQTTTKAALHGATRSLALELASRGVTVMKPGDGDRIVSGGLQARERRAGA